MKKLILILAILFCSLVGWGQTITDYPYFCGFENSTELDGWSVYDYDGDGEDWGWYSGQNYSHSGNQFMMSFSYDIESLKPLNPDNLLVTPHFIVPTQGELIFSWWIRSISEIYLDIYDIVIGTDNGWIWEDAQRTAPYNWTQYSISLQNYAGEEIYIVFDHWKSYDKLALLIDDVSIEWNNPLPITLFSFTAEPRYDHHTGEHVLNLLTIRTGYEYNNCEFIVLRSRDAINWEENDPVCDWDFGADSAIYNEVLDTILNYFNPEHPNGQTYYPVDYNPYDTTYYKLIQRDCDNTTTEYTSDIIVCMAQHREVYPEYIRRAPGGIQVRSFRKCQEVHCYDLLGRVIYITKMLPYDDVEFDLKTPYLLTIYIDGELVESQKVMY